MADIVYGKWAGDPKGRVEDITRCVEKVYDASGYGAYVNHQCSRKRGQGADGLYCKQHAKQHPATPKDGGDGE